MRDPIFLREAGEVAFQWLLAGSFFAAQAFVALGGVQNLLH